MPFHINISYSNNDTLERLVREVADDLEKIITNDIVVDISLEVTKNIYCVADCAAPYNDGRPRSMKIRFSEDYLGYATNIENAIGTGYLSLTPLLANMWIKNVLLHEILHGLGFNSYVFWQSKGLLKPGDSTKYVGKEGVACYNKHYRSITNSDHIPLGDNEGFMRYIYDILTLAPPACNSHLPRTVVDPLRQLALKTWRVNSLEDRFLQNPCIIIHSLKFAW